MPARAPRVQPARLRRDPPPLVKKRRVMYMANQVYTCRIGVRVDVLRLVRTRPYMEFNPGSIASGKMHFHQPMLTCLLNPSGQIVVTGARNVYAVLYAVQRIVDDIRADYPRARVMDIRLQNYTSTLDTGTPLDMQRCACEMPERCGYVPERFPGAHVSTGMANCMQIVFPSGRIVTTGARSCEQAMWSCRYTESLYAKYRLPEGAPPPPPVSRSRRAARPAAAAAEPKVESESEDEEPLDGGANEKYLLSLQDD